MNIVSKFNLGENVLTEFGTIGRIVLISVDIDNGIVYRLKIGDSVQHVKEQTLQAIN